MKTDIVKVKSNGEGREKALDEASKFATYVGLDEKSANMVRLLSEETLGMVTAITGDFFAEFWLDSEDGICRIHLDATTSMTLDKKNELIDASSDKKNAAYGGFLGRLFESIQNGMYRYNDVERVAENYGMAETMMNGGLEEGAADVTAIGTYSWSLGDYRTNAAVAADADQSAREAWDELEKTVLAKRADDVKVAVRGDHASLTVEKKF